MVVLAAMLRELAQIRNAGNNLTLKAVVLQSTYAWPATVQDKYLTAHSPATPPAPDVKPWLQGHSECALGVRRLVRCGIVAPREDGRTGN
jgi:hypothetical protein